MNFLIKRTDIQSALLLQILRVIFDPEHLKTFFPYDCL